jgi:hypothetical protein
MPVDVTTLLLARTFMIVLLALFAVLMAGVVVLMVLICVLMARAVQIVIRLMMVTRAVL